MAKKLKTSSRARLAQTYSEETASLQSGVRSRFPEKVGIGYRAQGCLRKASRPSTFRYQCQELLVLLMSTLRRVVAPSEIPTTMFNVAESTLFFPSLLGTAYRAVSEVTGNLPLAMTPSHDGETGGASAAEASRHFATAFSGSCARLKLAVLDPYEQLAEASNLFFRSFAGGRVGLLDAPCGAGAATAALLATLAELRRLEVIPAQPLDVFLVGGDISPDALNYAERMLESMRDDLRAQAIFVHPTFRRWDLMDEISTTKLLHTWMVAAPDCRDHFMLTANFSGFLHEGSRLHAARERLGEMFRWAAVRRSTVAWIEPQTNAAMKSMWPRLFKGLLAKVAGFFFPTSGEPSMQPLCTEARFEHPLRIGSRHNVRLSLMRMARNPG